MGSTEYWYDEPEGIKLSMIIHMYYENHVNRGTLLKRRSTRHVLEAIASEFGNSAKIIVPRSWLSKHVVAFLDSEFISKHPEQVKKNGK